MFPRRFYPGRYFAVRYFAGGAAAAAGTVTIWTGDVDGDFTDAGNWSNGVPIDSSTAIFADTSVSLDENLNQSGIALAKLLIHPSFTGSIGSEAAPLRIGATTVIINQRNGSTHLKGDYTAVYVRGTSAEDPAVTLTNESTRIVDLFVLGSSGKVKVIDGTEIRNVMCNPAPGRNGHVVIGSGVTSDLEANDWFEFLRIYGGSVFAESGAEAVRMTRGRLQFDADVWNGDVHLFGGSLHARGGDASGGKMVDGSLNAWSGLFAVDFNTESLITIDDIVLMERATVNLRTGLRSVSVTNGVSYRGGRLIPDRGRTLNVA